MITTDPATAAPGRGIRVIVADDSATNLLVLTAMLKRMGFMSKTAVNGVEAVSLVEGDVDTLILMDINMPEMNGIEAAMTIRQRHPDAKIRIVAVTAYPDSRHQTDYKLAQFDTLIAKPVNMTTLRRVLSEYFGDFAEAV